MTQPIIQISDEILGGMPVFYGTRVPVHNLIDYLATGETVETFLEDFPAVTLEQVQRFLETAEQALVAQYAILKKPQ